MGLLALIPYAATAQCDLFVVSQNFECDDGGTDNVPSDDTYSVDITVFNNANNNFWTETFGPYPVSTIPPPTVTVTDPMNTSCTEVVQILNPPTVCEVILPCPDFDLCYELVDSTNCSATYEVSIMGELAGHTIGPVSFSWFANGGDIDGVSFANIQSNPLVFGGVTINGNVASGGSGISGQDILDRSPHFLITVSTEPGSCVSLDDGLVGIAIPGSLCISTETLCTDPQVFCAIGVEVSGIVTAPSVNDCPDTENHGIEGAEIFITSANGEVCETRTENDGTYACTLCDDGPYEICVNTVCDEPCGVTDIDLIRLRKIILGVERLTSDFIFIGDVNGSGTVSTLDLVLIARDILGLDSTTIENWCRFVPVQDSEYPPDLGDNAAYAAIDSCILVTDPSVSTEFVRYMLGDIDNSCTDCIIGDGMGDIPIVVENDPSGNRVIVKSPVTDKLFALTLHISIPTNTPIYNISSPLPNLEYAIKDNEIHIIWIDATDDNIGYQAVAGEELIGIITSQSPNLTLQADGNYILADAAGMNTLSEDQRIGSRGNQATPQSIIINGQAWIDIQQIEGDATLRIYDRYGRRVTNMQINSDTRTINTPLRTGVYIFTIQDKSGVRSHKVFIR